MLKKIILLLMVLLATKLIAQEEKKIELSLGGEFLFPVGNDSDEGYLIGGSAGFGYIMSPIVVFSGSIVYAHFSEDGSEYIEDSPGSIIILSINAKRYILSSPSLFNPYLLLEMGFFIPINESDYVLFPEISGKLGLQFAVSNNVSLFIDMGYCTGINNEFHPNFIVSRFGVNFYL